jgi:hypothetical protein
MVMGPPGVSAWLGASARKPLGWHSPRRSYEKREAYDAARHCSVSGEAGVLVRLEPGSEDAQHGACAQRNPAAAAASMREPAGSRTVTSMDPEGPKYWFFAAGASIRRALQFDRQVVQPPALDVAVGVDRGRQALALVGADSGEWIHLSADQDQLIRATVAPRPGGPTPAPHASWGAMPDTPV